MISCAVTAGGGTTPRPTAAASRQIVRRIPTGTTIRPSATRSARRADPPGIDEAHPAGRGDEPFDAVVPLITPPDPEVFKRLEDVGMTSAVSYPPPYALGPRSSLADKRALMEDYAERIIRRVR